MTELKQNENKIKTQTATTPDTKPATACDRPVIDYSAWRFANVKLLHFVVLTEIIVIYFVLIVLTLIAIAFTFYYNV